MNILPIDRDLYSSLVNNFKKYIYNINNISLITFYYLYSNHYIFSIINMMVFMFSYLYVIIYICIIILFYLFVIIYIFHWYFYFFNYLYYLILRGYIFKCCFCLKFWMMINLLITYYLIIALKFNVVNCNWK